jgi:hypothetical protein
MPSPSPEYLKLIHILSDIEHDLLSDWPIIPRENLEAGRLFLMHVLAIIRKNPSLTVNNCVLLAVDEFKAITHTVGLDKVTKMQPNFPLLDWSVFKPILSCNTPLGDFIDKIQAQLLETKLIEMREDEYTREAEAYSNFANFFKRQIYIVANDADLPLCSSFDKIKKYGAC